MSSPISCVLRGDRRDLGDLVLALDLAGGPQQLGGHRLDRGVDALLELHRGGAGRDVAQALADHGLGQHGGGGGAVAGDVVGLGRDLLGQLGAEVLVRVVELDLAGDGDTVVGDRRRAELLVDDDVAALGAEGHLDGVGERVDAALEAAPGVLVELEDLGHAGFDVSSRTQTAPEARGRAAGAVRCAGCGSS